MQVEIRSNPRIHLLFPTSKAASEQVRDVTGWTEIRYPIFRDEEEEEESKLELICKMQTGNGTSRTPTARSAQASLPSMLVESPIKKGFVKLKTKGTSALGLPFLIAQESCKR
ncbi:hypothetical protein Y1Q_0014097 [Alligator mississippiensis]|uniref:Uncharacterized protein n=1 Tax=Alligator mississippiensis TaxID=8496 RepID=A0A151MJT5_ALLMI|nr:hypothetical protein Y1Q_0014097 [Alligator mississippiensis]